MSVELLKGLASVKTNGSSVKLGIDHLLLTGNVWPAVIESYIPISDCAHTFIYDYTYESIAGNYFYIGIERFDINKATGSNNCCIYQVVTNGAVHSKRRVRGTVNLNQVISSTNSNRTAYIRLRILNNWTGSSVSGATAKIYHLSVRELFGDEKPYITKTGILHADQFWEEFDTASLGKAGNADAKCFYEY